MAFSWASFTQRIHLYKKIKKQRKEHLHWESAFLFFFCLFVVNTSVDSSAASFLLSSHATGSPSTKCRHVLVQGVWIIKLFSPHSKEICSAGILTSVKSQGFRTDVTLSSDSPFRRTLKRQTKQQHSCLHTESKLQPLGVSELIWLDTGSCLHPGCFWGTQTPPDITLQ